MNTVVFVFVLVGVAGVALECVGRFTGHRCPTITDVARFVHVRRLGGWILFLTWALVGWHLLAS